MIELKNLTYTYRSAKTPAVNGADARITEGIWLLAGENGAGKTTLLRLIAGLLTPTSGQCLVDGCESHFRLPSILSKLCYFDGEMRFPAATAADMAKIHAIFYPRFSMERLSRNFEIFGLGLDDSFETMSLGNRRKAKLAYMLSLGTEIVLLDEPANGLDIESREQMRRMIAETVTPQQTVIVATHIIDDFQQLFDGIIVMNKSHVALCESTDSLLSRLSFVSGSIAPGKALYSELRGGRHFSIIPAAGSETAIDYTLIYKALHSGIKL